MLGGSVAASRHAAGDAPVMAALSTVWAQVW